ncbi:anti-sigma F factor antagonist [Herbivorax sp. ANBcel31]|uniref:anti-sigma F factor antagonist n=1 Tax=Herbivorax sp. ANBcel31 TaxID=3069754 RepID=UPI0027B6609C|nr:anti-sigma F factor antagonist [Herbivorax sp. ANBcel31]MDQ2086134.1 anti-sigma F factor antagonist [Herbivorax sp. ANBcel31]
MKVKILYKETTLIACLSGELDHHSAEYVRQKIDNELMKSSNRNMIFDFSQVSFMDSSGIGVIIGRYKNIQKLNGEMAIINVNNRVKRIFEMSGLLKIIPAYDNMEEAIKKCKGE